MAKRKIFSPISLGELNLKNRIVMAPMCMYEAKDKDGIITDFHKIHYGARALGQVGLINIEATAVEERGRITPYDLGLWNDNQAQELSVLVDLLHSFGSKVGIQLAHAGRKATEEVNLVAPSRIAYNDEYLEPKELSSSEIKEIVDKFVKAAIRAGNAGIDVIELHGAHGYLIHQFISKITNKRNDEYGGSLENRFRFLKEIVENVRKVYTGSLWVRLSLNEYHEDGTTIDEYIQICKWLKNLRVNLIDISTGGLIDVRPDNIYPGYQVKYGKIIKENVGINVSVVGLLNDPKLCQYIIENDEADLICLGRPLLANPNWLSNAADILRESEFTAINNSYERGRVI